jgi:hypothetical protein
VKIVHDLLDGRLEIPYMSIQDIDVRRTELLQAGLDAEVQRLGIIAVIIDFVSDIRVTEFEVEAILKRVVKIESKTVT